MTSSATATARRVKTGIVMLNMGGPSHPSETGQFLRRLFQDSDIIDLGGGLIQKRLGEFVARRRTSRIAEQYEKIGGSPIRKWTEFQGRQLERLMDETRPASAPHKSYVAFRYADPLTDTALLEMKKDGVERAVAFSQFPQWSCTTTGSSLNELWREVRRLNLESAFKWSIVDRFATHPTFIKAVAERVEEKLAELGSEALRKKTVLLFSAHSVPMKVVEKGDPYVGEVAASVRAVMDYLHADRGDGRPRFQNKHVLAWQSKVGYLPWMVPSTADAIESLAKQGHTSVLVVPVAFTSDHIETLFEIDIEYRHLAAEKGIEHFHMTRGLNDSSTFVAALGDVLKSHLDAEVNYSPQYKMKCLTCEKPQCRGIVGAAF